MLEDKPDFVEFSKDTLASLHNGLLNNDKAKQYLESRGINSESIEHFSLGYSDNMDMITVPVHSPDGTPVGVVGRSISDKRFKNSKDLPRSKTMFNIHRAKKIGDRVIVVESSFDAIRVHQAGFPNVVATLGGHISGDNLGLLNRYFNTILIMTDADKAGRDLGSSIAYKLSNKNILWASHSYGRIYPEGVKDAGDMSDEDIKACITNAISNFEYRT
jgi:DNA primase